MVMVSSLRPVSSEMTVPPVRTGDILQHGLASIAKTRGFDGDHIQHAAQLIQDQGCQRFAIDVLGNDQQLTLANLDQFFEDRDDVLPRQKFSCHGSGCKDSEIDGFHVFSIGHEVG